MTTRRSLRGSQVQESMDWVVPPDLNGTSTNGWWRLHLRIVFEDDFGEESDAAILCSSQPFSVQKTHALLQHGRLPAVDLRLMLMTCRARLVRYASSMNGAPRK